MGKLTVHWLMSDLEDSPRGKEAFVSFLKCQRCGSWFYAGRSGAKFCGNTCRVISHNQTDQARAERAAYMRKLRKNKANLKRAQAQSRDSAPLVSRSEKIEVNRNSEGLRVSIFKRGNVYWYHFLFNGEHIQRRSPSKATPARPARLRQPFARLLPRAKWASRSGRKLQASRQPCGRFWRGLISSTNSIRQPIGAIR